MAEDQLWRYVRDKLLPRDIHATRVENGVSAGFPDVHYTYQGRSGTLELKFLRKKNPPFWEDGLNRDQIIWIRNNLEVGGRVWILADIGPQICVIRGRHAEQFNEWKREDFSVSSTLIFHKRRIDEDTLVDFAVFL